MYISKSKRHLSHSYSIWIILSIYLELLPIKADGISSMPTTLLSHLSRGLSVCEDRNPNHLAHISLQYRRGPLVKVHWGNRKRALWIKHLEQ